MKTAARLLVAICVCVAIAGSVAVAQRARQVEGGGSFNDAPIVTEGNYTDTIRPTERLFYAVEVAAGQKLKVRANIAGGRPGERNLFVTAELRMHDPARDEIASVLARGSVINERGEKLTVTGEKVGGSSTDFAEPGLYYVSLALDEGPRRTQLDVDLKFTVKGEAVTASPTPTDTPTVEASPTPTPTEDPSDDDPGTGSGGSAAGPGGGDESDMPIGVWLGFFLAGIVGGSALEMFRGGRVRA
jgi:hypothetical protein